MTAESPSGVRRRPPRRRPVLAESDWQAQVVEVAQRYGWQVQHHRKSLAGTNGGWVTATTIPGWPDLTLYRPGRILFRELKTNTGRVSPEQRVVLRDLKAAGCDVQVWRPRDFDTIVLPTLSAHRRQAVGG